MVISKIIHLIRLEHDMLFILPPNQYHYLLKQWFPRNDNNNNNKIIGVLNHTQNRNNK